MVVAIVSILPDPAGAPHDDLADMKSSSSRAVGRRRKLGRSTRKVALPIALTLNLVGAIIDEYPGTDAA